MKVKKTIVLLFALLLGGFYATAQDQEIGVFLGAANYQGDLSENHITLAETRLGFGALYRYYFNPRLNFRGSFQFGWISGDDANNEDPHLRERNLHFRSHVAELAAGVELNILPFVSGSNTARFAPYVFAGIAGFHFNPRAELDGEWHDLQPLGTEGQNLPTDEREPYSKIQLAIPYGAGLKFSVGNLWNVGLEFGQRKLFTDYLDDVSGRRYPDLDALEAQNMTAARLSYRRPEVDPNAPTPSEISNSGIRGNPDAMDMYVFGGLTITRTIRRFSCVGFY